MPVYMRHEPADHSVTYGLSLTWPPNKFLLSNAKFYVIIILDLYVYMIICQFDK